MSSSDFVHLHVHSDNSLLDGGNKIDDLIERALDFQMPALALTDHGVMYGAWEFQKRAKKAGIQPIVGMEAYVAPGDRDDRDLKTPGGKPYYHLILLAQNRTGYENLVKLSSRGFQEGFYYKPRLDREILAEHNEGLIVSSACMAGEVAQNLELDNEEAAREAIEWYGNVFQDRYYLEVQAHETEGQREINRQVLELGDDMGLPVIATNDSHFLTPDHHEAHDVLICVGMSKDRDDENRMRYDDGLYFKSAEEVADFFPDHPEVLENTVEIAERCDLTLEESYHLPEFPIESEKEQELEEKAGLPVEAADEERRQAVESELLKELAYEGAKRRYGDPLPEEVTERIEFELGVIEETGYAGYFLIVGDFIQWAKDREIAVGPGRGSAAGSLVCYSLGITDVDPLDYDLLFERFLNPDRVSMPDIDIDFDPENRGRVIDHVRDKYGEESVAQIITFGTLKARAAIRDVGRVLNWELSEVDKLAKMIPNDPNHSLTIEEAIEEVDQVRRLYEEEPRYRELLDYASRIEGLRRHSSIHAAGVVIAPGPVDDFVPVEIQKKDGEEVVVTQYDMDSLEEAGMLKMDFLGLRNLSVIGHSKQMAEDRHDVEIDWDEVDLDDPKTYEMIRSGVTAGIFQFESSLATDKLMDMRADSFDDLVATNALLRPGPLDSGMTDEYIARKLGKKKVSYPHPDLEEVLDPTYGIIVYQEQVMRVAQVLADYTLAEADVLRKAVGKKKQKLIETELTKFKKRCAENGVASEKADELATLIETFGRYGFNKSHSAAYSMLSFRTAYLKAHYPEEFMAALLSSEIGNTDKIVEYMGEARKMDLEVLPPDVRTSGYRFNVVDTEEDDVEIRFGLGAIRNIGESVIRDIIAAREEKPFDDYFDFVQRSGPAMNSRVLDALINAGALDSFGANRAQMLAAADQALAEASRLREERERGQFNLFGDGGDGLSEDTGFKLELPDVDALDNRDRLAREKESLGLYVSGHPLEGAEEIAEALSTHQARDIREEIPSGDTRIAGVVTEADAFVSRAGNTCARVTVEDLTGSVDLLVFSREWARYNFLLEEGKLVVIEGYYKDEDRDPVMFVNGVQSFGEAVKEGGVSLTMRLEADRLRDESSMERVQRLLAEHAGSAPVYVEVLPEGDVKEASSRIRPSNKLLDQLREMFGRDRVQLTRTPDGGGGGRRRGRRRSS